MKSTYKKSKGGKRPRPVQVPAINDRTKLAPAHWLLPVIVALLTVGAFLPALHNGFVSFDDDKNFLLNPHYRGLGLDELRWMFTAFHMGHYIPLTWLTLGLNYILWGMDPAGYLLTNLLLHVATAVAFYFLTIRLLRLASGSVGEDEALWVGAAFAALIFAIHPLRVESVVWITERRDVLSGLFYVLTILAYFRASDRAGRRAKWYWVSVILFACALLSKSMAVSLPVVLLILDVYPLRRLGGPVGWWSASTRQVYTEKIPFVLLAGVVSAVAFTALSHSPALESLNKWSPIDRLGISGFGLGFYLWKTVAPLNLSPIYPLSIKSTTFIFLSLILIVLTFALRHRLPGLLAALLAYVVILLPVIGIFQNGPQIAADRYTYLSCLGWAVLAGASIFYCWRPLVRGRIGLRTFVFINGLAVVVVVGLGGLTWKQTQVWRDSESLWRHTISVVPESKMGHYNLGNEMVRRGERGEAIKHFRQVLRIKPDFAPAYNNLGVALFKEGKITEAAEHFCQSLRLGYAQAQKNLRVALARLGEKEDAVQRCQGP